MKADCAFETDSRVATRVKTVPSSQISLFNRLKEEYAAHFCRQSRERQIQLGRNYRRLEM